MLSHLAAVLTLTSLVGLSSQRPGVLDEISMLEASNSTLLRYPTDASFEVNCYYVCN